MKRRGALATVMGLGASLLTASAASGTPPGQNGLIACSTGGGLAVVDPREPSAVFEELDSRFGDAGSFTWSPDGGELAFGGEVNLSAKALDGSNGRPLTRFPWPEEQSNWAIAMQAAWSPSGTRIAYTREEGPWPNRVRSVWTTSADGSGTHLKVGPGSEPAWSPDGTRIAYSDNGDIFHVLAATGADRKRVTNDADADVSPTWSPDGQWIAYVSDAEGAAHIFARPANGGSARRQITFQTETFEPVWSPDGTRIAYVLNHSYDTPANGLWTAAATGGNELPLRPGASCYDPDWQRLPVLPAPVVVPPVNLGVIIPGATSTAAPTGQVKPQAAMRLSVRAARARTREFLADRYPSFRRALRRSIGPCARLSETRVRCVAAWRTKRFRFTGHVITRLTGEDVAAKGTVHRVARRS